MDEIMQTDPGEGWSESDFLSSSRLPRTVGTDQSPKEGVAALGMSGLHGEQPKKPH